MGRLAIIRALAFVLFAGSAALAQQGLIVEPWRKPPAPVAAPVRPARIMPASGLPRVAVKPASRSGSAIAAATAEAIGPSETKWSPPVVELLGDPWAKLGAVAAPARASWVPQSSQIIDPWAGEAEPQAPAQVAAHPAEAHVSNARSTIF